MIYQILFIPRSGSSWLAQSLNKSNYGTVNYFEILKHKKESFLNSLIDLDEYDNYSASTQKVIVERIKARSDNSIVGFKYERSHINNDCIGFIQYTRNQIDKTIIMKRENAIDWALSQIHSLNLSKNNIPVNFSNNYKGPRDIKYNIDILILEYFLISYDYEVNFLEFASNFFVDSITISYEDLFIRDKSKTLSLVSGYLGLPSDYIFESELERVRSAGFDYILNIGEVYDYVVNSKWASLMASSQFNSAIS